MKKRTIPEYKQCLNVVGRVVYVFGISQEYYQLPIRIIKANGNIYHTFKPKFFRDVQNLYQDKASTDKTLNELIILPSTCWNEKYSFSQLR